MRRLLTFALLCSAHVWAQTLSVYPTVAIAPIGTYQTVTAVVQGVNNKTVTWSITSGTGTLVGTNPCVVNEPCTIALYDTTAETDTLTATTNVGSVTATSTVTFTGSPTPATSHPRLLVTAAMLPGLRAKATSGNTLYQALRTAAVNLYTTDSGIWTFSTWNGSACVGGSGPSSDQSQSYKEGDANLFAFMSMIDPSDPSYQWGCAGRDIFTYMMDQFIANPSAYGGNHWSDSAKAFTLTPDWLMAGGYLNSTDLIQAREFLAAFAKFTVTNSGNGTLAVIGNYNSSSQFDTGNEFDYTNQRAMGNNYTQSKMLYLVADALTFNDNTTDDPPLTNTCSATRYQVCPDGTAGSLHAYWTYFTGGMMYKDWADMEDPNVTWQAYQTAYANLSTVPSCDSTWAPLGTKTPCFGLGRGGEPSEGNSYGGSISKLKWALDAAYTAGYLDPIAYGPQMSLASSSYWDLRYITDLASLTGPILTTAGGAVIQGSTNFLNTGDELTYYKYPSNFVTQSATMLGNSYIGRTEGDSAMLWTILNTAFGGPLGTSYGCPSACFYAGWNNETTNTYAQDVLPDLFITQPATDPLASLPADPRPSLPTDLYDAGNQHIVVRNNWTSGGTLFSYYAPNTAIDHEHEFDGRFDIYSDGEYITKGRAEFNDYNDQMTTAPQQNLVALQNNPTQTSCTVANSCEQGYAAQYGGQFWHSYQQGLITLLHSELPTYVAAIIDQSNAYNGSTYGGFGYLSSGITASRSLIYLRGSNQVVYYDRGDSTTNTWTKQLYLMTTGNPTISGSVASWLTRSSSQKAYFTSLLPSGATITNAGLTSGSSDQAADWEPYTSLEVNPSSVATNSKFLSVMEWGTSSLTQSSTTLVQSTGGQNFDCGKVGASMVCFMRAWPATFTGVTYPASGATTQYVSDLTPNTVYTVAGTGAPSSATSDTAGVLTFAATGTGNITLGTPAPQGVHFGANAGGHVSF